MVSGPILIGQNITGRVAGEISLFRFRRGIDSRDLDGVGRENWDRGIKSNHPREP